MTSDSIRVEIELDEQTYEAGSVASGRLRFKVHKPMPFVSVSKIGLLVEGEERTAISFVETIRELRRETDDEASPESNDRQHYNRLNKAVQETQDSGVTQLLDKHKYVYRIEKKVDRDHATPIQSQLPLTKFPHALPPGEYDLPFHFTLPKNLPATMRFVDFYESSCELRYRITPFVSVTTNYSTATHGLQDMLYFPDPSMRRDLIISSHPSSSSSEVQYEVEEFNVTSWCWFCREGWIKLGFHLDHSVLSPGSVATVNILGKNLSKVPVRQLQVSLVEKVTWKAQARSKEMVKTLAQQTYSSVHAPQWQANRQLPNFSLMSPGVQDDLNDEPPFVSLTIPKEARVSYKGKLIQVSHFLVIRAVTTWYASSPSIEFPVRVSPITHRSTGVGESEQPTPIAVPSSAELLPLPPQSEIPLVEAELIGGGSQTDWKNTDAAIAHPASSFVNEPPTSPTVSYHPPRQSWDVAPTAPSESLLEQH